jgi:hypothetical protein
MTVLPVFSHLWLGRLARRLRHIYPALLAIRRKRPKRLYHNLLAYRPILGDQV